ncbi:TetR/AcrR family transcriptional regulator [Kribbella qitaiheensis]|uniref:TetR/AcrR family transcriptional regulator n=1 Tax=Kribbella qitaiheensis TaxID=1544730 RepID=A0A7G6WTD1_9ACTN|nr:TetR/AcrR family transcriptional regulator [Kribbella qitaiheensis]QNE17246.1 TetR/AcrR family transcriptional regulator [Kribbella qitaiheensis]
MTELLWGPHQPPSRGPKPAMTLDGIARAAIKIADAEGLDAVSMQRVAGELSFTKMSLYRYVPGKAELVAVMTDLAIGTPADYPLAEWREALTVWAMDLYATFGKHPWLLQSTVGRRVLGPNELSWMDRGVQAVQNTGLTGGEQLDSVLVVTGHIRTIAQQSLTVPGGTTGVTEDHITAALTEILSTQADRFPGLAAAMTTLEGGQNQGLSFGLDRILDGLEALIQTRVKRAR